MGANTKAILTSEFPIKAHERSVTSIGAKFTVNGEGASSPLHFAPLSERLRGSLQSSHRPLFYFSINCDRVCLFGFGCLIAMVISYISINYFEVRYAIFDVFVSLFFH